MDEISLIAQTPNEMVVAQNQLIDWCVKKIEFVASEVKELFESYEIAKRSKWKSSTLYNHYLKAKKRLVYYEKIKSALEHGFYIVPNFPVQVFAIRTGADSPSRKYTYSYWDSKTQEPQTLTEGEGEYKNPEPETVRDHFKNSEGKEMARSYATDWEEEIEFPVTMRKPIIMEATSQAMALKIFDQFGVLPPTKKEDPIIVGQIKLKTSPYSTRLCSFMIAWHLDTRVL